MAIPAKNWQRVHEFTKQAAKAEADVVVFPELWNTVYGLEDFNQLTDPKGEDTRQKFAADAKSFEINIVGGSVRQPIRIGSTTQHTFLTARVITIEPLGRKYA